MHFGRSSRLGRIVNEKVALGIRRDDHHGMGEILVIVAQEDSSNKHDDWVPCLEHHCHFSGRPTLIDDFETGIVQA